ncbi:caffeic acid 3-O-methyltransferase 1-like [Durio zibethinus]|uniref:Caffeic acid 3-O-methyltransferase 1-like n=1 Tax=Durio zibethinus TaxID=66656 RepID=A0A6P5X1H1_DURZI|nr:caffeic acid 3-O-methyltransferase 1-like [Durio zibethinus]
MQKRVNFGQNRSSTAIFRSFYCLNSRYTMNFKESQQARTSIDEEDKHAQQYAMQLVSASVMPMVLKAAVQLGVFDIIERAGPVALLSASQIASQLPTQNNPDAPVILDRILRLLASHSILTFSLATNDQDRGVVRLYGLAPVAKYFIRSPSGGSLSPLLDLYQDKAIIDVWYQLKDAVLEGGLLFNRAHGISAVEYVGKDARFGEIFKDSMIDYNNLFVEEMLKSYMGFDGLNCLVDLGGGNGSILHRIVSKYPAIKGINFDLPHIIEKSPSYPGIEHVAGDMFKSVPKGDAIFMKWILHGLDDKRCVELLKNCYEALPVNGKVIIVDLVIPESPDTNLLVQSAYQFDLFMMHVNESGKERREKEFESLAKGAGFSRIRVACYAYSLSVVEFYKNV